MSNGLRLNYGGKAVAFAGLLVVFAGATQIGLTVMLLGFLIALWSDSLL